MYSAVGAGFEIQMAVKKLYNYSEQENGFFKINFFIPSPPQEETCFNNLEIKIFFISKNNISI